MSDDDDTKPGPIKQAVGKAEEALGWATADRRVEAKGKLDQLSDGDADADPADGEAVLDEADLHVRSDHGDLAPEAEPSDEDQPVKAEPKTSG
ncbi:MAG: hypothetical protein ACTHN0_12510 [Aquihabitans sp.]